MQKFRIVPSQKNMFWQLVQGMRLEEEEKALLRAATIRHVEVCTRTNSWEIALSTQTLLSENLLASAADQIAAKYQLDSVIFYQDVVNIEDALAKIWPKLVYETAEGNPTVYELLKRSKYTVDGSHILIDVPGELGGEIMRAHSVTQTMSQLIEKRVGYRCHVECEASEEVLQNLEVDDSFQDPDYLEALQHVRIDREKAHVEERLREEACGAGLQLALDAVELLRERAAVLVNARIDLDLWHLLAELPDDIDAVRRVDLVHHILRRVALDDEDLADIVLAQVVLHRELLVEVDVHRADVRHRLGKVFLGDCGALPAARREAQEIRDVDDIDLLLELAEQGELPTQGVLVTRNKFY